MKHAFTFQHYAAMAAGMVSSAVTTQAQVVYTDIDPDIELFSNINEIGAMHFIDMDGDGSNDIGLHFYAFYFSMASATHWQFNVDLSGENKIAVQQGEACSLYSVSSAFCYFPPVSIADIKDNGTFIDPSGDWGNIDQIFQQFWCGLSYPVHCTQGDFSFLPWVADTLNQQFIPVEIHNTETHYGWLRLRFEHEKLYITDMAYNQTPNEGMLIEEQEYTNVQQTAWNDIQVFYTQQVLHVRGLTQKTEIIIRNISGEKLFSKVSESSNEDFLIDVPAGIYLVEMHDVKGILTRKILVH
ncbi:MAG: T9SS type A sorting domain-containing protein [Chitinophagales bacterium]